MFVPFFMLRTGSCILSFNFYFFKDENDFYRFLYVGKADRKCNHPKQCTEQSWGILPPAHQNETLDDDFSIIKVSFD